MSRIPEPNPETMSAPQRAVYEEILNDILVATEVPYANIQQCGNFQNHSLELAQKLAVRVLDAKHNWRRVI